MKLTDDACTSPDAKARAMTSFCAGAFGAVSPLDRPSWLVAEPRITAKTRSPSRTASVRRLSTTTPAPSPRTKPSAATSNALHRPRGESIPHLPSANWVSGCWMRLTPPASPRSVSRERRLWQARCSETNDDEHAVSTATAGPRRPRR
ncbi:Uncharacterised protein [Mycobacteroides abscessus subsp. abscessus]|nr:Uncharacterised protein [Mycobacteroides abscessus subsp. abscessus]